MSVHAKKEVKKVIKGQQSDHRLIMRYKISVTAYSKSAAPEIKKHKMNAQQIEMVRKTWAIFQKIDPVLVGEVFYDKLFNDNPPFRRMFKESKQIQAKKIIAMLDQIVKHIDTVGNISHELKNLGARHRSYGVKSAYYRPVGVALLWMLEQGLGSDWNEEVKAAWNECYHTISEIMIDEDRTQ